MSDASDSNAIPPGLEGPIPQDGSNESQLTTRCCSSSLQMILHHCQHLDLWILLERELAHIRVKKLLC